MSYIGVKPTIGNFQICDAISVVNGQAAYTMQVGSVNVIPQSANHMIVSLNGTIQKPNSSFTVSGAVITFSSNLATGDVIDFIQILGDVLDLGVPSDGTVTSAKITYPLTTFSSTGIDDNADALAMTIDSSENVGIKNTTMGSFSNLPATDLVVGAGSTNSGITIYSGTSSGSNIGFADGASGDARNQGIIQYHHNGDYMRFFTSASEKMRIHSGGVISAANGIALGVGTADTASNVLNDYEEGTFTPTWGGSSSVSVSSGNYGYYTKIGNVVTVHFGAILTSTSNSYYQISNAPFQSNIASGAAMGSGVEYGHTGSAYKTSMGDNSTTINVSSYQNNAVANAYFHMSLTYRTD